MLFILSKWWKKLFNVVEFGTLQYSIAIHHMHASMCNCTHTHTHKKGVSGKWIYFCGKLNSLPLKWQYISHPNSQLYPTVPNFRVIWQFHLDYERSLSTNLCVEQSVKLNVQCGKIGQIFLPNFLVHVKSLIK